MAGSDSLMELITEDSPMDDASNRMRDVIDHCFKDTSEPVKEKEQARYDKLCVEFGM